MLLLHLTVDWRLAKKHYVVGLIPEGLAGVLGMLNGTFVRGWWELSQA